MCVPDLKDLVCSAWPVQDVGYRNDWFCTVVRYRSLGLLGWLSKLVNAEFGRFGCKQRLSLDAGACESPFQDLQQSVQLPCQMTENASG